MNLGNPNCQVVDFLALEGVTTKAVASTGVVYLYSYPTEKGASYAFEYKLASSGAIDVKVELEQANVKPATEGSADGDYVVPEDAAVFDANVVNANNHIKAYAPAATGFVRLKLTGQGSNAASTVISRARMSIIQAA
jgi:hypothetical protein